MGCGSCHGAQGQEQGDMQSSWLDGDVGIWLPIFARAGLPATKTLLVVSQAWAEALRPYVEAWHASLPQRCPFRCCAEGDVASLWANVGADWPRLCDAGGNTLLHAAAASPCAATLAFISHLPGAADLVNGHNCRGKTPLHLAAVQTALRTVEPPSARRDRKVELLMAIPGVDVELRDLYGASALILAARAQALGAVEVLLAHKADVNAHATYSGPRGATALAAAVNAGNEALVRRLLQEPGICVGQALILGVPDPPTALCVANSPCIRQLLTGLAPQAKWAIREAEALEKAGVRFSPTAGAAKRAQGGHASPFTCWPCPRMRW